MLNQSEESRSNFEFGSEIEQKALKDSDNQFEYDQPGLHDSAPSVITPSRFIFSSLSEEKIECFFHGTISNSLFHLQELIDQRLIPKGNFLEIFKEQ